MPKQKSFDKTDREKQQGTQAAAKNQRYPALKTGVPAETKVSFPENVGSLRTYDFAKHYGHGFDAIIAAMQQAIEIMLSENTRAQSTIASYCNIGIKYFCDYLVVYQAAHQHELTLDDVTLTLTTSYIHHLKTHYPRAAKPYYAYIKSVLVALQNKQWLARFEFPRNPFPNSNRKQKGQKAFSRAERQHVVYALKEDVTAIIEKNEPLSGYELTLCLLAIAARSGMNTTPLLEMTVDSIQDHPLKDNRKLLVLYKRRGNSTQVQSLRWSKEIEKAQTVMPDVAVIVDHIIKMNAGIRNELNTDSVFVYRGAQKPNPLCFLASNTLNNNTGKWVKQRKLMNDNGEPFQVNVSRFRKTFENRIFELSGGDPFVTAAMAGHTVKVSDSHYLEAPAESEKNWQFMGKVRTEELLGNIKVTDENTPVAKCAKLPTKDKNGQKLYCMDFLKCLRCRNMVVTKEDLYRLYSFYWLIIYEREEIGARKWKKYYSFIMRAIDRDVAPQFDADYVESIKAKAKIDPHPAWKRREQLAVVA